VSSIPLSPRSAVLEVGCGDGFVLVGLFEPSSVALRVGIDPHFTDEDLFELGEQHADVRFQRELDSELPERFELVLLLDVLEHVEDDLGMLRELVTRRVSPGGHVVITVPAYQSLFGHHDRALRHLRRYDPGELARAASAAGLDVLESGHWYGSLLPLRWVSTKLDPFVGAGRRRPIGLGGWNRSKWTTRAIDLALRADNRLLSSASARGWDIPGLTEWMHCQKPWS
jgi:SAM-dependent methyltransferase